jgi:hypothetical protein
VRMAERQRQFSRVLGRFLVYDDRVDVLAITGSKQRIDHSMSPDEARALWADLCQCGWHRASEDEVPSVRCRIENCVQSFTAVNLDRLEPHCIGSVPNVLSAASDHFAVTHSWDRISIAIADTTRTG